MKICMNCGNIVHESKEQCQMCKSNLLEHVDTDATIGEYIKLSKISSDGHFIKAMLELHKQNIIEYQLKLGQLTQSSLNTQNTLTCPKCGSTNVTTGARGWKWTTGFIGSGKTVNRCGNCGYTWKPKR